MNWNPQSKPPKDAPSMSSAILQKNAPENPAITALKKWIKKLPFFMRMDYYRRKIYDSPLFDYSVKPLARLLAEWPRSIVLDITNRCNAKCSWCPQPQLEDTGAMSMDLYRKIIDDYAARGGVVRFGTFGEPLMDKTFAEKIQYLQKYPSLYKTELVTNAFFLKENIARLLIDNKVDVEISLDELEKRTFEDIKKMSFDMVCANVLRFLELNDAAVKPVKINLRIKSSFSRQESEAHKLFKKLSAHNCTIELTPLEEDCLTSWAGRFDKEKFYAGYLRNSRIIKPHNHKEYNKTNVSPCNQLWKYMVVYWDGSVVLCCVDMFSTQVMGDLRKQTIREVFTGAAYTEIRRKMVQRKRFEIPLCRNCDLHLSWHNLKTYYDADGNHRPHRNFVS